MTLRKPTKRMTRMTRMRGLAAGSAAAVVLGLTATLATATPALACPPLNSQCSYDVTRPAWMGDTVVTQYAQVPPPEGHGSTTPDPALQDIDVYLIGYAGSEPFAPEQSIPGVGVIPAHDHVWPYVTPSVMNAYGHFVVPGPKATAGSVLTRPAPQGGIVGAPLAYAIVLGGQTFRLTNLAIIQQGIDRGLLSTVDAGFGGDGWIEPHR